MKPVLLISALLVSALTLNEHAQSDAPRIVLSEGVPPALSHLHLTHYNNVLQITRVSTESAEASMDLSPYVARLETRADGSVQVTHVHTHLSEVVDHYWHALTALGFEQTHGAAVQETVVYTFQNEGQQLEVEFTPRGEEVALRLAFEKEVEQEVRETDTLSERN